MEFKEQEELEFQVTKNFLESKLGSKTGKFTNKVILHIDKDEHDDYDCFSDLISQLHHARECIPNNAKIQLHAVQFGIVTMGEMEDKAIKKLEGFGWQYQSGGVGGKDDECVTTIFGQMPEHWDQSFEEFLKTYPDFLRKKYELRNAGKTN